jgi:hypothetical protein
VCRWPEVVLPQLGYQDGDYEDLANLLYFGQLSSLAYSSILKMDLHDPSKCLLPFNGLHDVTPQITSIRNHRCENLTCRAPQIFFRSSCFSLVT